jgi:hypothetical protein
MNHVSRALLGWVASLLGLTRTTPGRHTAAHFAGLPAEEPIPVRLPLLRLTEPIDGEPALIRPYLLAHELREARRRGRGQVLYRAPRGVALDVTWAVAA